KSLKNINYMYNVGRLKITNNEEEFVKAFTLCLLLCILK
ncbi:dihydrolipoamide dehydrogenase, partial [Ehrlichia ruminantium]